MTLIGKIVGPVVGLTAEAMSSRKNKTSPSPSSLPNTEHAQAGQTSHEPNHVVSTSSSQTLHRPPSYTSEADHYPDSDEEAWELDDAVTATAQSQDQPHANTVPKGNAAGPATIPTIVAAHVAAYPLPHASTTYPPLALPVILPQRRPRDKSRGFVRAYAPALDPAGISADAWLSFLDAFDEATRLSPVFNVVNMAAQAAGMVGTFLPSPTLAAVVVALQAGELVARRTYERVRTNGFMERMNEEWWMPQGLYCLVMRYKPEGDSSGAFFGGGNVVEPLDLSGVVAKRARTEGQKGSFKVKIKTLRSSDGVSRGEVQLPPAAPLVWPAIDAAGDEELGWWKRKSKFVQDYSDRRAQAMFMAENEDSKLGMKPEFRTKWADPATFKQWEDGRKKSGLLGRGGGNVGQSSREGGGRSAYEYGSAYEQRFYDRGGSLSEHLIQRKNDRFERRSDRLSGRSGGLFGNGPLGLVTGAVQLARGKDTKDTDPRQYSLRGADGKGGLMGYAKKTLRPDVLYLMVVPMPSQEELNAAREVLEVTEV